MEPIYTQNFEISANMVDCWGRLKNSQLLYLVQEMGGQHSDLLAVGSDALEKSRLFWAVTRHRVQITRIPVLGEQLRLETWPLPTTKVAFPRSVVAYDREGRECFRAISLWVLMDLDTRKMILPGKSGISVVGTLTGKELTVPGGLPARLLSSRAQRQVCFSDIDRNGHMNNTRCLDWSDDLFPTAFHRSRTPEEIVVCYHTEAREGEVLQLHYELMDSGIVQTDGCRVTDGVENRVFSLRIQYAGIL